MNEWMYLLCNFQCTWAAALHPKKEDDYFTMNSDVDGKKVTKHIITLYLRYVSKVNETGLSVSVSQGIYI